MKFCLKDLNNKDIFFNLKVTATTPAKEVYSYLIDTYSLCDDFVIKTDGEIVLRGIHPLRKYFDIKSNDLAILYLNNTFDNILANNTVNDIVLINDAGIESSTDNSEPDTDTDNTDDSDNSGDTDNSEPDTDNIDDSDDTDNSDNSDNSGDDIELFGAMHTYVGNARRNKRMESCLFYTLLSSSVVLLGIIAHKL